MLENDQENRESFEIHNQCKEELRRICEELGGAVLSVEEKFLKTGELLMGLSSRADDLSRVIESVKEIMKDRNRGMLAEYLRIQQLVMEKLEKLTSHVREGLDEIRSKNVQITHFRETCSFIDTTSRNLSIIALNIKVQSGHLQEQEDSFFSFGKEIKGLASELAEVSSAITADSLDTQSEQKEQLKKIELDLSRFEDFILSAVEDGDRIKSKMVSKINELVPEFETANICTRNISREVSALVVALQAHDIVRQRIEHVCEILDEIVRGERESGRDILTLQVRQLGVSLKELVKVKVVGVSAFTLIHKNLAGLMQFIASDRGEALGPGVILEDSLFGLLRLLEYLGQGKEICRRISVSIDGAMSRVRRLEQYVEKAKELNQSLEMKAINAIVMTAGLKRRSKPFRILGQRVNELSRKSIGFADEIRGIIESIIQDRRELGLDTFQGELEIVNSEVARLREQYGTLQEQIVLSGSGSKELQDSILEAGHSMVFVNAFISRIEEQIVKITDIYCGVGPNAGAHDRQAVHKYTMESEREVYRSLYGEDKLRADTSSDSEVEDSIILF